MENTTNSNGTSPQAGGSTGPSNNSGASSNPQFTGMPRHSILSAQADLNTNSVSGIPKPVSTPSPTQFASTAPAASVAPAVPKPEVKPVMSESKPVYQGMPEPQTFSVPRANPVPPTVPVAPVSSPASSLSSNPASYTMPTNQKHEVVFDDSTSETTEVKNIGGHLWAIIVSSVVVILLLGGGFYYWYYNMNGKDMLVGNANTEVQKTDNITSASVPSVSQFPAGVVNNTAKPQSTASKPVDSGAFGNPATEEPAGFDSAEKEKITAYISQNINKLSSAKSKEPYTVTDIQFDGPNRAIVSYSNSQYNISAVVNVYIDKTGNVKVSGFSILEK